MQDDRILHYGQYIGVVVAETAHEATAAARLIETGYELAEPLLDLDDPRAEVLANPWGLDAHRGDVAAGLESADVTVEETYTTPDETNNPMGLFATVAAWDGDSLTVHDSTQGTAGVRSTLAAAFGIPESGIRVLAPFVGGGFGAGIRVWPHVVLAALAARTAGRPVKLVLTRPQMFTGIGHRTRTVQRVRLGADRGGHLTAISHDAKGSISVEDETYEPVAADSATAYACPNVDTRDLQARLNIPVPTFMRAPGESQGNFALESALDELAYALGMDPVELRLRNYAEDNPQTRPAVVEQGAARLLRAGRRAVRLAGPRPAAWLDARRRGLAGGLRHGRRQLLLVPAALPGEGHGQPGRDRVRAQRRDRHRHRHLHRDDPAVRRDPGPGTGPGPFRPRRHRHADGAHGGRLGPDRGPGQRRPGRLPQAHPGVPRHGRRRRRLAPARLPPRRGDGRRAAASSASASRPAASPMPPSSPGTAWTS